MKGTVALVGSGEYLPAMAMFEKSLIDDGQKNGKENKYVQIPTAASQEGTSRVQYWKELGQTQAEAIDSKPIFLPIFNREDAHDPKFVDQIREAGLVYMSGGDPHYLAKTLIDTPVWAAILQNWQSGGSLAGCSAGAMVLSSQIPNFRLSKEPPTVGLDLISNVRVIPHFDKFFRWIPESAAKVLTRVPSDSILIGIDELTAIAKRTGEDFWTVYGQAELHVLKGLPEQRLGAGQTVRL
jgi:cyanophycinase-like exopeptidase